MLWDLIRDYFVQYIFGGCDSYGEYFGGQLGFVWSSDGTELVDYGPTDVNNIFFNIGGYTYENQSALIGIGDWLSTTATIISITIIFVLCCMFVYKIIKLIGGLIR